MKQDSNAMEAQTGSENDLNLIGIAIELGKEKKVLFGVPTVLCILTALYSLTITPTFTAKTIVLPPQQQQSTASSLIDQLGPLAGMAMGAAGIKNPSDLFVAFLKSNAVRDRLIQKFGLQERYKKKNVEETRKMLAGRVVITLEKLTSLITIAVSDKDPQFAATLANAHIEAMQELMGRLALSDARRRRVFFEEQVDKISQKPFRDMRVQEFILAAMMRQLETARIDESKEGPLLQQVDAAVPPERKSKPKRATMVFLAGVAGLILGACAAMYRSWRRRIAVQPELSSQLEDLKRAWELPKNVRGKLLPS